MTDPTTKYPVLSNVNLSEQLWGEIRAIETPVKNYSLWNEIKGREITGKNYSFMEK